MMEGEYPALWSGLPPPRSVRSGQVEHGEPDRYSWPGNSPAGPGYQALVQPKPNRFAPMGLVG